MDEKYQQKEVTLQNADFYASLSEENNTKKNNGQHGLPLLSVSHQSD